jgi:hypothetical protein
MKIFARRAGMAAAICCIALGVWRYCSNRTYHQALPIVVGDQLSPLIDVEIEGETYYMLVDTGSKFPLRLSQNALSQIKNKKFNGSAEWRDIKGVYYQSPSYLIHGAKISNIDFNDVVARGDNENFEINTSLWEVPRFSKEPIFKKEGVVGRPLLQTHNLLMDYHHRIFWISNHKEKLAELGYDLQKMIRVPFRLGQSGIIFDVYSDLGRIRFCLDTGASVNIVRDSFFLDRQMPIDGVAPVYMVCTVQNQDIGKMAFHPLEITPLLTDIDGILGTTFLDSHVVYIDFESEYLYIKNNNFTQCKLEKACFPPSPR